MSREDIEKLLGGYATGTLTPEERDALFAAALEDQKLFEALAREEPLRELLQDPVARARLSAALERRPQPGYLRWLRPAAWAVPAVALAAIVAVFVIERQPARQVMIAQAPALPRMGPVAPVPSALPQNLEKRDLPLMARAIKAVPAGSVENKRAPAEPVLKDTVEPLQAKAEVRDQALTGVPAPPPPAAATAPPPPPPAAPAPPPPKQVAPAPLNPPAAAQQVIVVDALGQQGQQSAGVRVQAAEGVQVGAVGGFAPVQDARAMFFGQQNAIVAQSNLIDAERSRREALARVQKVAATAVSQLGLRYSILRRLPSGQFGAVIPNEVLDAADQIEVRVESNDAGSLSVFERGPEGWRPLASSRIERLMPYTVPASGTVRFDREGPKDLFVVFSRQPQQTAYPVPDARLDQLINANLAERLTYVVSTAPPGPAQTIAFPITLTHK